MHSCSNPDVLKVIYFITIIIDIIKIGIPIILIVMGFVDITKAVVASDNGVQKKAVTLFIKRIIYAIAIFLVPTIVSVTMVVLGNSIGDPTTTNFTDCIENATKDKINHIETNSKCYQCSTQQNLLYWGLYEPSSASCSGEWKTTNISKNSCVTNNSNKEKYSNDNEKLNVHKNESSNNNTDNDNNSSSNNSSYDYIVYIGDSRTVGMCDAINLNENENCEIAKIGVGYAWLTSSKSTINNTLNSHPNSYVVINLGTNGAFGDDEAKKYATFYNELANTHPNCKIIAVSVTQIEFSKANNYGMFNYKLNGDPASFNKALKSNLNNVSYCDVYSKLENFEYKASDGVHYDNNTYKFIYDEIQKCLK